MISFDVKKLIYKCAAASNDRNNFVESLPGKKIKTSIPKNILREILYQCTKEVHFMFNDEIYVQSGRVAMGSPLGPLPANIFMTS